MYTYILGCMGVPSNPNFPSLDCILKSNSTSISTHMLFQIKNVAYKISSKTKAKKSLSIKLKHLNKYLELLGSTSDDGIKSNIYHVVPEYNFDLATPFRYKTAEKTEGAIPNNV